VYCGPSVLLSLSGWPHIDSTKVMIGASQTAPIQALQALQIHPDLYMLFEVWDFVKERGLSGAVPIITQITVGDRTLHANGTHAP
jgi:hypothetical protein